MLLNREATMDKQRAREEIVEEYITRTKCTIEEAESFDDAVKASLQIEDNNSPMFIADFFILSGI
jgi:hypothetical protein